MRRRGIIFDRSPGALVPIDFDFDIDSEEYMALWPDGGERWSVELEVFHNPLAAHPFPHSLLPEAAHWYESSGEIICSAYYENAVLASLTHVRFVE